MNKLIAFCGLECEKCDAYIATKNNDQALREKTAKLWSKLNNAQIQPEHINCEGCRMNGAKTRHFGTSKAVIKELKKYIPQYDKTEQFLCNQRWVEQMSGEGRQAQASAYADKMDTSSGSYTRANIVFPHIEQQ